MILAIDTTSDQKSIVIYWPKKIKKIAHWQANEIDTLQKIDQLLSKNHLSKKDIKLIVVNRGPGSFTGIRKGISIANALSFALDIPIIGIINKENIFELARVAYQNRYQASRKIITPYYGQEPNITKAKKLG